MAHNKSKSKEDKEFKAVVETLLNTPPQPKKSVAKKKKKGKSK